MFNFFMLCILLTSGHNMRLQSVCGFYPASDSDVY